MNSESVFKSSSEPSQDGGILPFSVPFTAISAISSAVRPVFAKGLPRPPSN